MNFTSPAFLLGFPVVVLLHWRLPHRWRWALLLAASYLFYMGHTPALALLLLAVTVSTYAAGLGLSRRPGLRPLWLLLGMGVPLGTLALFKYGDFFLSVAGSSSTLGLLLPVGISFYTFQTLSYVLDVYRGEVQPEGHFGYYALFVSFFPQLVAGPIERPEHLLPQLHMQQTLTGEDIETGLSLLAEGFFRKLALADVLAQAVEPVYQPGAAVNGTGVVLGTVCFALQIYCDFSGYSLIALGAARLLGVRLSVNFRQPYDSATIGEFWRRWHITLNQWFADYVYRPLGGNRKGLMRQLLAVAVVFALSGLWHGAAWHFVAWGCLHGLYRIGGILWERLGLKWHLPVWLCRCRTFALVCVGWLLFRADSLSHAGALLAALTKGWSPSGLSAALRLTGLTGTGGLTAAAGALCLLLLDRRQRDDREESKYLWALRCFLLAMGALFSHLLLSGGGESVFLYFQF